METGKYIDSQNLENSARALREAGLLEGELTPHQKQMLDLAHTSFNARKPGWICGKSRILRGAFESDQWKFLMREGYAGVSDLTKFIRRIRGKIPNPQIQKTLDFIEQARLRLDAGDTSFRSSHIVKNEHGIKFLALDAAELNIGGCGGRGNWRYLFFNNHGKYEFRGLAEHLVGDKYRFYYR